MFSLSLGMIRTAQTLSVRWRGNDKVMLRQHKFKQKSTELITAKTLTWFALFSQRFVLRRLSTPHHHLAGVNGIFHHRRFLSVEFRFGGKTFEEPFAATTHSISFNIQTSRQRQCCIHSLTKSSQTERFFESQTFNTLPYQIQILVHFAACHS